MVERKGLSELDFFNLLKFRNFAYFHILTAHKHAHKHAHNPFLKLPNFQSCLAPYVWATNLRFLY